MFKLQGVYAPIPTPYLNDEIAYEKLDKNLDHWLETKLSGLVVMGSNGEFVFLDPEEKRSLTEFVCNKAAGKKPVIVGTGAESTRETIRLSKEAGNLGASAVLIVTPHYYKSSMTPNALKHYYLNVAEASTIPLIIYNMPGNTGINIPAKLISELSVHPNIIGVKDTGGNIVQISEIINSTSPEFTVFAGSASYFFTSLAVGAKGGTLSLANIFPNELVQIQTLFNSGQIEQARKLQLSLLESNNAVTARWGVAGLKSALDYMGLFGGDPRLPVLPLEEADKKELHAILDRAKQGNPS